MDLRDSILFFDSGVGGLTVLAECVKTLCGVSFAYYGDNRNAPYGNQPSKRIQNRVSALFKRFALLRPAAVVLACNTVTALCAESLREKYPFPIIGTEPAVFSAARSLDGDGTIFVLSTRATHESIRFQNMCVRAHSAYPRAKIQAFACERLAGEIERRMPELDFDLSSFLPKGNPNAVVLGCTHYGYLKEKISAFYGCPAYDSATGICNRIASVLELPTTRNHNPDFARVSFLGIAKRHNRTVFEQTFGLK